VDSVSISCFNETPFCAVNTPIFFTVSATIPEVWKYV
jgi:hypothetical protein